MGAPLVGAMWPDDRAVSPVVGVILIVAIVVILAAGLANFSLTAFDAETTESPSVALSFEYDEGAGELTVRKESGDEFESANVEFEQADGDSVDTSPTPDWPTDVDAGDAEAIGNIESDDTVRVVWVEPRENGKTAIIGTWEGPDA